MQNQQVIAQHLSVEEVAGIKEGFHMMDIGNRGKINIDELRVGLHKLGHQIPDTDVQILMDAVSHTLHLDLAFLREKVRLKISFFRWYEIGGP